MPRTGLKPRAGTVLRRVRRMSHKRYPRLNILYVNPGLTCSGGVRVIFEHCSRLMARDHNVVITAESRATEQDWYPDLGVPIIQPEQAALYIWDAVVATGCTTPWTVQSFGFSGRWFYLIQGKENAFFPDDPIFSSSAEATYRMPEFTPIAISRALRKWLAKDFGRAAYYVPNGINRRHFSPDPQPFPRVNGPRVLIEGSQTHDIKGTLRTWEAIGELSAEVWALTCEPGGIPANKTFVLPEQQDLRRIYSSCDVLVKTILLGGCTPLPIMEAMSCGCAVVTTNTWGIDEYCVDDYNCLIVPDDLDEIREATRRLLEDRRLRTRIIEGGFATSREKFWWHDKIDLLEAIYAGDAEPPSLEAALSEHAS